MALFFTGFGLPEFDENAAPGPSQLTPEAGSGAAATATPILSASTMPAGDHGCSDCQTTFGVEPFRNFGCLTNRGILDVILEKQEYWA